MRTGHFFAVFTSRSVMKILLFSLPHHVYKYQRVELLFSYHLHQTSLHSTSAAIALVQYVSQTGGEDEPTHAARDPSDDIL